MALIVPILAAAPPGGRTLKRALHERGLKPAPHGSPCANVPPRQRRPCMSDQPLKKTPLNSLEHELGGKMIDFGGWELPVQFTGILDEHEAVRTAAGLFDVSHMGEITVKGPDALTLLQRATCND